jgi:hypothetical protein
MKAVGTFDVVETYSDEGLTLINVGLFEHFKNMANTRLFCLHKIQKQAFIFQRANTASPEVSEGGVSWGAGWGWALR